MRKLVVLGLMLSLSAAPALAERKLLRKASDCIERDQSLYLDHGPPLSFWVGGVCVAAEDDSEMAKMSRVFLATMAHLRGIGKKPASARVAVVGGGTCILPELLVNVPGVEIDVYEIVPEFVEEVKRLKPRLARVNFVVGDYRETLPKTKAIYDVVAYDAGQEALDMAILRKATGPNGLILVGDRKVEGGSNAEALNRVVDATCRAGWGHHRGDPALLRLGSYPSRQPALQRWDYHHRGER